MNVVTEWARFRWTIARSEWTWYCLDGDACGLPYPTSRYWVLPASRGILQRKPWGSGSQGGEFVYRLSLDHTPVNQCKRRVDDVLKCRTFIVDCGDELGIHRKQHTKPQQLAASFCIVNISFIKHPWEICDRNLWQACCMRDLSHFAVRCHSKIQDNTQSIFDLQSILISLRVSSR